MYYYTFRDIPSAQSIIPLILGACIFVTGCGFNEPPKLPVSGSSNRISISQDGTLYYVSSKSGIPRLYACNIESPEDSHLIDVGEGEIGWPFVATDGSCLVFTRQADAKAPANICHLDFESGEVTQVTQNEFFDASPSLSSDGSKIVFVRATELRDYSLGGKIWSPWDVYSIDIDGSNEQRLTHNEYYRTSAPFYTDNDLVVFSADVDGNMRLLTINLPDDPTQGDAQYVDSKIKGIQGNFQSHPSPYMCSDRLAFLFSDKKESPFQYEIWSLHLSDNTVQQVTSSGHKNSAPTWSPDGKMLFYLSDPQRDGRFEIRKIDVDGTNESVFIEEDALY